MDINSDFNLPFLEEAINIALKSIGEGGGPFGAVVVNNGEVIAGDHNRVALNNDPTAHAEVMAIRKACKSLNTFDLSGCDIYCSCEPCPMCLSAIYWARISRIFYASNHVDAENAGFSDAFIYNELKKPIEQRFIPISQIKSSSASTVFKTWLALESRTNY